MALLLIAPPLEAGEDRSEVNPTGTLTLREALRLTLLQNPSLAASDTAIRAAEGRLLQAGLRPNPVIFTENENLVVFNSLLLCVGWRGCR